MERPSRPSQGDLASASRDGSGMTAGSHRGAEVTEPSTSVATCRKVDIGGLLVDATSAPRAAQLTQHLRRQGDGGSVVLLNVYTFMLAMNDPTLYEVFSDATLVLPDGAPIAWAGRLAGAREIRPTRGADLVRELLSSPEEAPLRAFFFGTTEETLESLTQKVAATYPNVTVVGAVAPPFNAEVTSFDPKVAEVIVAAKADIVFVGLSAPKQERWMANYRSAIAPAVAVGVGAAFDFLAGTVHEAPRALRGTGLEWLWRLAREPRRLWRRYLWSNPRFVVRILRQRPRLIQSSSAPGQPLR